MPRRRAPSKRTALDVICVAMRPRAHYVLNTGGWGAAMVTPAERHRGDPEQAAAISGEMERGGGGGD